MRLLAWLAILILALPALQAGAASLVLNNVGNPTTVGTGAGKRAIWTNAGTVGGVTVDLVATLSTAALNHTFTTQTSRAAQTSVGVEDVWMTWRIFQAGTYNINTNSGGVPVLADIHIQLNDLDGPNNERAYVPICDGSVSWVRVQKTATTGRTFGTVATRSEIFSLVGDKTYNAEPESGVEVLYPNTSTFQFGHRANNGFYIRLDKPSYTEFDTYDFACGDFRAPVAADDTAPLAAGPTTVAILLNDSIAIGNPSGTPSEWGLQSVSLTAPAGATGIVTDSNGHTVGFTVPGEGSWSFDDTTGLLTFTPVSGFANSPTPVSYVFYNAVTPAVASNAATVTLTTPLDAVDDTASTIDGSAGNASVLNIFSNDTAGGGALNAASVNTTIVSQTNPAVTLDPATGTVSVAPGTPAGSYSIVYRICEKTQPSHCDDATVSVGVVGGGIDAVDDGSFTVGGAAGNGNVVDVLSNDTLSGAPVNPSAVTTTVTAPASNPNVALDPATGIVSVAPNTPAGTYTIGYQICEILNPANCSTGTVHIQVTAAAVLATNDTPAVVNGFAGSTNVIDIFSNDTLNGAALNPAEVDTTILSQTSSAVTLDPATGIVSVAPNTPAGSYTIDYQVCEKLNPTNCSTAVVTVSVTAAPILAANDTPPAVDGTAGNSSVVDAFANDTLNGGPVALSAINATVTTPASNPNVQLNVTTGTVSVAPGTPGGTYSIDYQICEKINPANCSAGTVTVVVTAASIVAANDTPASVNGFTGGGNVANVLSNDTVGGNPIDPATVTITTTAQTSPNVSLDPSTGIVSVASNTPAGTYTIDYQVCEVLNPANCASAVATVVVTAAPILAANDTPAAVNGAAGSTSLIDAFANDVLNGTPVVASAINATVTTPASNPNVQLNVATGTVSVAPGTPAGTYSIDYQICEKINPANCSNSTITVTVTAATVIAGNDTPASVNGLSGGGNVVDIFANDTLNGAPINPSDVTTTIIAQTNPAVTLNPATGIVSVAPNTPAGTYTIDYQVCEKVNPANCTTAVVTVSVTAAPIDAVDDAAPTVPSLAGDTAAAHAFANDTLNGAPVSASAITATVVTPASNPNVAMNTATGVVSVAPNTPAGTYTIEYRICEVINPANCDQATVTVPVTAATINAVNDSVVGVSGVGGNVAAVDAFANDTLNGAPVAASAITATITAPASDPKVAMNPATGIVSVAPNTPAGTYTIDYRICEVLNPANCDSATVTVGVAAAPIDAVDDAATGIDGAAGAASALQAFANDTLNGAPVVASAITATIVTPASNPNVAMNPATGVVSVAPNTPAGTYTIGYRICEVLNPANCDQATAAVVVGAPSIDAVDDAPPTVFSGVANANIGNAFANDTLNGSPVVASAITATIVSQSNPNVQLDPATGAISVGPTVAAGTYTIGYRICEVLNPANCDPATITVVVDTAAIRAVDDAPPAVAGSTGSANVVNAFANDTLNGAPVVASAITATIVTPASNPNVAMNTATGVVSVAANTPAGTYTIEYRICEVLNPANCDPATVTIVVGASSIDAVDDAPPAVFSGAANANIGNAFANDTLNGAAVTTAQITATIVSQSNPNVQLDPATGIISVGPTVAAGTYTIDYRICDILNPANCDQATITVVVDTAAIRAVDDAPPAVAGGTGSANVVNAFANDTLNGAPVVASAITATIVTPASNPNVAMNPATGVVSVAANTPAGTYTIEYRICEVLNPANCDPATVTVVVGAGVVDAADDTVPTPFDTKDPIANALNVLGNDTLDASAATPSRVTVAAAGTLPGGFTLGSDGVVGIAQGTPSGSYGFDYRLCEIVNPTNCDTAHVSVTVLKSTPSVSGIVFFDNNGNGVFDPGEERLADYLVELRQNGALVQSSTSGSDGSYHFAGFAAGSGYQVVFIDPASHVAVGGIADLTFAEGSVLADQNQPIDPSGVVYNALTGEPLAGATLEMRTAQGARLPNACLLSGQQDQVTGANGRYRFDIVPGAAAQCPSARTEYLLAVTGYPGGVKQQVSALIPPQPGALDAGTCPLDAVPGGVCQLSAVSTAPAPGAPTPYFLAFLFAAGDRAVTNNHIPLDPQVAVSASGLSITKRSNLAVARRDDVVSYVIVVTNQNAAAYGPVDVVDKLPVGLAYVQGSARVAGVAVTPLASSRTLTFRQLTVPARGSVEVRLAVRVGADVSPGDFVNQAWVADSASGQVLTAVARATVRVIAEHVFDCGEVIGKVFDDRNRNGVQDDGEKGLPGVRVVTVNGVLITTDKYGRFSVPCAELPDQDIGSNFILKLDTRTLPDGYHVTTENPRVVRLTAGKVTKLNFGATASNIIRIEVTGRAFKNGQAAASDALVAGIGKLGTLDDKKGSLLKVTYRAAGEPAALVKSRIGAVRGLIAKVWRQGGKALPYELRVVGAE